MQRITQMEAVKRERTDDAWIMSSENQGSSKKMRELVYNVVCNSETKKQKYKVGRANCFVGFSSIVETLDTVIDSSFNLRVMEVPDSEFHEFHSERLETCFAENQMWAIYDDDDVMPRFYGLIREVISKDPFKVRVSWLIPKRSSAFGSLNWVGKGFINSCGDFWVNNRETDNISLKSFSHKVKWVEIKDPTRQVIRIYPGKGEIWALFKNWSPNWNMYTPDKVVHDYEMVEVLDDYCHGIGVRVAPLLKVAGFGTVFYKQDNRKNGVEWIRDDEMCRFSHQIPSYELTGEENFNVSRGCVELDPAAVQNSNVQQRFLCGGIIPKKHLEPSTGVIFHNSETVDRISGLPDKLLCHILAFLSTRCAVSTSILSQRWKYVWTGISTLDFSDMPSSITNSDTTFTKEQYVCFQKFVNNVLLLNATPYLKYAIFQAYKGFCQTHVYEWIFLISRRFVEELFLITKDLPVKLPISFLTGKEKLVVLYLDGLFELYLPPSVHFPSLEILSLIEVVFQEEHGSLSSLVSSCPVLKELNIERCQGLETFSVNSSSVKTLRISSAHKKKDAIIINTPNLEVLHLALGNWQCTADDLLSLVEARLQVQTSTVNWIELLRRICYTRTLVLYGIILDGAHSANQLLVFQNLTRLEIGFTAWSRVLQIVLHAPKLLCFIIHKLIFDQSDIQLKRKSLPLERIEYHGFDVEKGFDVVRYLLSNSALLKELKIYMHTSQDSVKEKIVQTLLLNLPRASNECRISISFEINNCSLPV